MFQAQELKRLGISQSAVIQPNEIVFDDEVRAICEGNACRQYGRTWACPPGVGSVNQCRKRCLQYKHALVFSAAYPLEDSFDLEGMMEGHRAFKDLCDGLYSLAAGRLSAFLLLSNEGCARCEICTYPHQPCRMPERLFPSIEGFGIQVARLARLAGMRYHNGANTVTYFGMLLY